MLGSTRAIRVYAHTSPIDLRKGYDGLYGLVVSKLSKNPLTGDYFLFTNRSRDRAKVLFFDGTGLVIYMKRLESGRFPDLGQKVGLTSGNLELTISELNLFFPRM